MDSSPKYKLKIKKILNSREKKIFENLNTPEKIQDFLDRMPINFKDTHHAVRFILTQKSAQCMEGALLAAAALAYHGEPPLLLDLRTILKDEDHVIALFRRGSRWGAISKTNHAILRFRDPLYRDPRELALSYFHEYAMDDGKKTLREFSAPFDLRGYKPEQWITAAGNIWHVAEALDRSKHFAILPKNMHGNDLRLVSPIEREALQLTEWKKKAQGETNPHRSKN